MIFLITKTQKQASKITRWYYIFHGSAAHNLELNDCQGFQFLQFNFQIFSYFRSNSMKNLFVMGMMAMGTFSSGYSISPLKIAVGTKFTVQADSELPLSCEGGVGDVSYEVEGPDCVDVKQDKLHVCKDIAPGNYPIRVRAMDAIHRIAEKIITLSVVSAEEEAGGSSGGGSTGGSSTVEGSIDQRYNRLINSYSSVITHEKTTYEDNRYPQVDFPTGYNTEDINLAPYEIARNRAQTSEENRNVITSQDVALKAASERHQNAVKGITNLLKVIDQARANKKYAESQLEVYVKQYNDALAAQRKAQNAIIAAETKRTQIFSAIEGANGHIDGLKAQIYELDTKRADLEDAKKGLLDKISAEEKTKAKLIAELEKINAQLANLMKEYNAIKERCASIEAKIGKAEAELAEAKARFADIMSRRMSAEQDVQKKAATVDDLRKKLLAAEKALTDAEIKLSDIRAEEKTLPALIEGIEVRLAKLSADWEACQAEAAKVKALIDALGTDDLTKQIEELESVIINGRKKVMEIDAEIAASLEPLEDLKAKLKAAQDDLAYLKTQIAIAEETLRQAYTKGNDANTKVAHGKDNLEAINVRYQEEDAIACEATLNLERARAEEALSRLALEEIIAHYSDALPYSIVPHGNGQGAGRPFGNNPSGSALGPIKKDGDGAPGVFTVDNFTHYLSLAYGAGVNPSFHGSVTKLFPFSFLSKVEGNKITNPNLRGDECGSGGYGPVRVASGEVISMHETGFKVRVDTGEVFSIEVDPCTKLNANVAGYHLSKGDEAIFKGVQKAAGKMVASQVTCLSK